MYISEDCDWARNLYCEAFEAARAEGAPEKERASAWRLMVCALVVGDEASLQGQFERVFRRRIERRGRVDWMQADYIAAWAVNRLDNEELIEGLDALVPGQGKCRAWFLTGEALRARDDLAGARKAFEKASVCRYGQAGWGAAWARQRLKELPAAEPPSIDRESAPQAEVDSVPG